MDHKLNLLLPLPLLGLGWSGGEKEGAQLEGTGKEEGSTLNLLLRRKWQHFPWQMPADSSVSPWPAQVCCGASCVKDAPGFPSARLTGWSHVAHQL